MNKLVDTIRYILKRDIEIKTMTDLTIKSIKLLNQRAEIFEQLINIAEEDKEEILNL